MLSTDLMLLTILTWSLSKATTIYKEVLINETTNITCIPNEDIQIQWHHTATNGTLYYLYAGGRFYVSSRVYRLENDSNTGPYHLVIPHARTEDAGLYECKEDNIGSRVFGSTQLTVLESSPVCNSNMKPEGYVGPNTCKLAQEDMTFTCAVSFSGEPPQVTWKTLNGSQPFSHSTCKTENGRKNCSLTVKADSKYDGSIFNCQLRNLSVNCSKEVIKIHYFESQESPLVMKNCNQKLLQFNWTRLLDNQYVLVIENQELLIQNRGFYKCAVKYSFRNLVCVGDGSEVNALPLPSTIDCETGQAGTAAIGVLSIIVAIAFVSIAILVYCFRGKIEKERITNKEALLNMQENAKNGGQETKETKDKQANAVDSSSTNTQELLKQGNDDGGDHN